MLSQNQRRRPRSLRARDTLGLAQQKGQAQRGQREEVYHLVISQHSISAHARPSQSNQHARTPSLPLYLMTNILSLF